MRCSWFSRAKLDHAPGARNPLVGPVAAVALAVGLSLVAATALEAQESNPPDTAEATVTSPPEDSQLPLKQVVIFTSGVGYFKHDTQISGDVTIDLRFETDDINDLLKSMVVQDSGGGQVSSITYDSKDPISRTLKTFAIDLTENTSLADILRQARGATIRIGTPEKSIEATIVGVDTIKSVGAGGEVVEQQLLTMLRDGMLQRVPLEMLSGLSFADARLQEDLQKALAVLASSNVSDKKTVRLNFTGEGDRDVSLGYVREMPVWKTTYRLVLDDEQQALLQGWALVENTTEGDWENVQLSLVSGRPISFIMNLYEPTYLERPEVQQQLYANLRPQEYNLAMEAAAPPAEEIAQEGAPQQRGRVLSKAMPQAAPGFGGGAAMDAAMMTGTVQAAATGGEVGELFQYVIDNPVTLPRQQSAMLPIVSAEIEAEKLSIYRESADPQHPFNGARIKNTTDVSLMQGPITVFDGGIYAGDAQLGNLPAGENRLISYGLDLDVEVSKEVRADREQITSVKIVKGTLVSERKLRQRAEYTVKNSASKERDVLIEQARQPGWTLVEPSKSEETTRDAYRFRLQVPAGESKKLSVVEELLQSQSYALTNLDANMIQIYVRSGSSSDAVNEALRKVIGLRQAISELDQQIARLQQQTAEITHQQERIRGNMGQLDRNTDLYRRYVDQLGKQEDQLADLQKRANDLRSQRDEKQQELDKYLSNLDVQ